MDAVEFLREKRRMCINSACDEGCCPLFEYKCCHDGSTEYAEQMVAAVEKWAREHPSRTRQSEFLKMFPNAPIKECGIIDICPNMLGELINGAVGTRCCVHVADGMTCDDCTRIFWLAEIKDGEA